MKSNNNILKLKIDKSAFNTVVCCNRIKLNYKFTNKIKEDYSPWQEIYSSGTYLNSNNFVNEVHDKLIKKIFINNNFFIRGVNPFQFSIAHIYPYIFFTTQLVEILNDIFKNGIPKCIVFEEFFLNEYSFIWNNLIKEYSIKYKIKVVNLKRIYYLLPLRLIRILKFKFKKYGLAYLVRNIKIKFQTFLEKNEYFKLINKYRIKDKEIILLVTLGETYWDCKLSKDIQFSKMIEAIYKSKNYNIVVVDIQNSSLEKLKKRNRIREGKSELWINYNIFSSNNFFIIVFFKKIISRLFLFSKLIKQVRNIIFYKDINIINPILFCIKYIFFDISFESEENLITSNNILSFFKPKYVITTHDAAPIPRSFIIEASRLNIDTIGIQHGTISNQHYDYNNKIVSTKPIEEPLSFAIPSKMLLWGKLWKEILIKNGNYPETSLIVIGNWRLNLQEKNVFKKKSINHKKKIIIFSSVWHSYSEKYFEDIFEVLNDLKNIAPLIKVHPSEENKNILKLKKIIFSHGYDQSILYNGPLVELLENSDIVISEYSTVLLESVLYKIPIILFNPNFFKNYPKYFESYNVFETVGDKKELEVKIKTKLSKIEDLNLIKNRKLFIEDIFYSLDKKQIERFLDLID